MGKNIASRDILIISKKDDDFLDRTRRYFGEHVLKQFQATHVLIVGMGAIGNEVLKNLAPLNIGKFTIVDPDIVTMANLNRCILFSPKDARQGRKKVEAARDAINRWIPKPPLIDTYPTKIQEVPMEILQEVDLVICGVDNDLARLHVNQMVLASDKTIPLINGAMGRDFIDLHVLIPKHTACLACSMSKERVERLYQVEVKKACDEFFFEVQATFPAISTLTSIVGGFIATEVIKLLEKKDQTLETLPIGKYYRLDIRNYNFFKGKILPNPKCAEVWCRESPKWSS